MFTDQRPRHKRTHAVRFTSDKGKVRRLNGIILSRGERQFPLLVLLGRSLKIYHRS